MYVHIAVILHMRGNSLANLSLIQFEILIFKYAQSALVGHNILDGFMKGISPLRKPTIYLNIPLVVEAVLMVIQHRDLTISVYERVEVISLIRKLPLSKTGCDFLDIRCILDLPRLKMGETSQCITECERLPTVRVYCSKDVRRVYAESVSDEDEDIYLVQHPE